MYCHPVTAPTMASERTLELLRDDESQLSEKVLAAVTETGCCFLYNPRPAAPDKPHMLRSCWKLRLTERIFVLL